MNKYKNRLNNSLKKYAMSSKTPALEFILMFVEVVSAELLQSNQSMVSREAVISAVPVVLAEARHT